VGEAVTVGIVAAQGIARELAEGLTDDLPHELSNRFGTVVWRSELAHAERAEPGADSDQLEETVREQMLEHRWDLGVGLTELPLRAGRRPVTAHASATRGVALVSVPALGAVRLEVRLKRVVLHLVDGLLGESVTEARAGDHAGRHGRMARRLEELSSPLGRARVRDDGTTRFVGAVLRGNLRLLLGMVRANQPTRVIARLSAALVGALGAAAFALASSNTWDLAVDMGWPRLLALAALSVAVIWMVLVVAHGLWERTRDPAARERVVLFNLATSVTVGLAVLSLYLAMFAVDLLAAAVLIPPGAMRREVGHGVEVGEYVRLAWLVASMATIGGALGSLVESDIAVQNAAQRRREDSRIEDNVGPD
jgi:uncharacterized membrane protein